MSIPPNDTTLNPLFPISSDPNSLYYEKKEPASSQPIASPETLQFQFPVSKKSYDIIQSSRNEIIKSLHGLSQKMVIVVGPDAIFSKDLAIDFSKKLSSLQLLCPNLILIMRTNLHQRPSQYSNNNNITENGNGNVTSKNEWKGLISDPFINGLYTINTGMTIARSLLLELTQHIPIGGELVDTIAPQYLSDLISLTTIGTASTESQLHRELASGLSYPIGFHTKDGDLKNYSISVAKNGMESINSEHYFLSVTKYGTTAVIGTTGNEDSFIIIDESNLNLENKNENDINLKYDNIINDEKFPGKRVMINCGGSNYNHIKSIINNLIENINNNKLKNQNVLGLLIESGESLSRNGINWNQTTEILTSLNGAIEKWN